MVADLRMASPAAVELVNPKHRNERKTHMALITSYHVPGLYVEDHSIDVPLDWRGLEPMLLAVGSTMRRGAMPAPIAGAPEMGWRLTRATWGQGYATEAAAAAIADGFQRLRFPEILAFTSPTNLRSQAVMRRLGMTRRAELDFDYPGEPVDLAVKGSVVFALTKP